MPRAGERVRRALGEYREVATRPPCPTLDPVRGSYGVPDRKVTSSYGVQVRDSCCKRCGHHIYLGRKFILDRGPYCVNCHEQLVIGLARAAGNGRAWYERTYGITLEQYGHMFLDQGGVCCICQDRRTKRDEDTKALAVDHDHETGRVRGLLCFSCNTALGLFGDSMETVAVARAYLAGKKASPTVQALYAD